MKQTKVAFNQPLFLASLATTLSVTYIVIQSVDMYVPDKTIYIA